MPLTNLDVKTEDGTLIPFGSKEFEAVIRTAAKAYPDSVAETLVKWADFSILGVYLSFPNPIEGFYERDNIHIILRDCGFKIQEYDIQGMVPYACTYGVADNLDQISAHFKPFLDENPERNFIISFSHRNRHPGSRGGWRWHKWGPYIGTQEPMCEYLNDEPLIESIITFNLIEILDTINNEEEK